MSRKNNEEQLDEGNADLTPPQRNADSTPPENNADGAGSPPPQGNPDEVLTIEEHQKNRGIDLPVFHAVMQAEDWAASKKVPLAVFQEAVENFLGAPMGGQKK